MAVTALGGHAPLAIFSIQTATHASTEGGQELFLKELAGGCGGLSKQLLPTQTKFRDSNKASEISAAIGVIK